MISESELERIELAYNAFPEDIDLDILLTCMVEIKRLRQGLKDIIDPINMLGREAYVEVFSTIKDDMAISLKNDPDFLRSIALTTLGE